MPKNRFTEFTVEDRDTGQRLDVFLAQKMSGEHSRARLQKLIKNEGVLVNGRSVVPHYPVKEGEKVRVEKLNMPVEELPAEAIPLDIIYEDEDCLVVNKPAGMLFIRRTGIPTIRL